jgi:PAS domain S-box-containing protein
MTAHAGGFSLGGGSRYFRALLDSLLDAVVIADEHGAVWGYNEAAHRLFGYAPGEVVGRPVSLLMPAPCWRPDLAFVERPADEHAREASRQQVEGYRRDGSRYRCELDLTGFVVGGQRYVVGVARPSPGGIAGHALQDPV